VTYKKSSPASYSTEVSNSANSWTVLTDVNLSVNSSSTFNTRLSYDGATGFDGYSTWNCPFSIILSADSRLNTYYVTTFTQQKRQAIWVHEMGHSLGLNHASSVNYVMWQSPAAFWNATGLYSPRSDDVAGMNFLY
jgi:hypothetical protein